MVRLMAAGFIELQEIGQGSMHLPKVGGASTLSSEHLDVTCILQHDRAGSAAMGVFKTSMTVEVNLMQVAVDVHDLYAVAGMRRAKLCTLGVVRCSFVQSPLAVQHTCDGPPA